MRAYMFHYHFPHVLVKHAFQTVRAEGHHWTAAAAKADREVAKRPGIKGKREQSHFKRTCIPVEVSSGSSHVQIN